MNQGKELIKLDDPQNVIEFLQQPATKLAEFITGVLVSDSKDLKLSAGHLIQASIKWKLYSQLGKEIKDYIDKGKIKPNYLQKDIGKQSLSELLKFIDEKSPEEDCFNAMKALFIKSVASDSSEEEKILSYQFMKICKNLESGDLLILKAAYDIKNGKLKNKLSSRKIDPNNSSATAWLKNISDQIGHGIMSLIEVNEDHLIKLKLIGPRTNPDKSGIVNKNYRLTDLGCKLSEFIHKN